MLRKRLHIWEGLRHLVLNTTITVFFRGASRSSTPRRDPRNLDRADISISAPLFARNSRWGTYMYVRTYAYVRGSITVHTSIYVPYVCSYVVLTWSRPTISSKILAVSDVRWSRLISISKGDSRSRLDLVSISPRGTRGDRDAPLLSSQITSYMTLFARIALFAQIALFLQEKKVLFVRNKKPFVVRANDCTFPQPHPAIYMLIRGNQNEKWHQRSFTNELHKAHQSHIHHHSYHQTSS